VNHFYSGGGIALILAHGQAEEKRRQAARQRLARAVQGPHSLRRGLGLVLTAWGQNLLASSREAQDEWTTAVA